jgi:hypothetical protein
MLTILKYLKILIELTLLPFFLFGAFIARFSQKPIDIGLGPEPLINNKYHKKALNEFGYSAETFVYHTYYITDDFDINLSSQSVLFSFICKIINPLFFYALFRYKCIYIYFNGGLFYNSAVLWNLEPYFYKLAKMKVVVMPYGSDIQEMSRSNNLLFKHFMTAEYPGKCKKRKLISKKIDKWTIHADHIISGCDWVDYMYYWDTLMLGHFSIDTEKIIPDDLGDKPPSSSQSLKILHAPNHRALKGSQFIIDAVNELKLDGYKVELVLLEKQSNEKVLGAISQADIVVDQLIVGWYAMFAIEAMALGKPVLCYLRNDLEKLYVAAGLIENNEIPIINSSPFSIKEDIKNLLKNDENIAGIKKRGRNFVEKHHSLSAIGEKFDQINRSIGVVRGK